MNQSYIEKLRKTAVRIKKELIQSYTKGMLFEYINEESLSIEKNEDNEITHILFTYGGPTVYLDFENSPGVVIASHMSDKSQAAIPFGIWSDMRNELEELYV